MPYRRLIICTALAMLLAACAGSPGKLAVDLTGLRECRKLTVPMKVGPITKDTDYRVLSAESLGTINKGNKAIVRRNNCDDRIINDYATAN